jgi:hypothetical protein
MNDTYFFGKRMNLNQGGRVNFNQGGPGFYNQADQELYAGGLQYLPQEQYRLGLGTNTGQPNMLEISGSSLPTGIMTQTNKTVAPYPYPINDGSGGRGPDDDDDDDTTTTSGRFGIGTLANVLGFVTNPLGFFAGKLARKGYDAFKDRQTLKDIETRTTPGVRNDPNTVGGSSRDSATGGSFGRSANEATGAHGPGTGFSDYS